MDTDCNSSSLVVGKHGSQVRLPYSQLKQYEMDGEGRRRAWPHHGIDPAPQAWGRDTSAVACRDGGSTTRIVTVTPSLGCGEHRTRLL